MASSRGRERAREVQRNFAFGSSTPRDLSHLNKIPTFLRTYDSRVKIEKQEIPPLSEFMKKARSLSRNGQSTDKHFVFGSSTPRDFSHLEKVQKHLRRYDAVIPKKSVTTPSLAMKRSSTSGPPLKKENQQPRMLTPKDDDISSEPDFVQDRADFLGEIRKKSAEAKAMKGTEALAIKQGEPVIDFATSEAALDLHPEQRPSQRIPTELHEDDGGTAKRNETVRLSDQIVVQEMVEQKVLQPDEGFGSSIHDEDEPANKSFESDQKEELASFDHEQFVEQTEAQ